MPEFLDFGKNTVFILACYSASLLVISGLVIAIIRRRVEAARKLLQLEKTQESPKS
ncbi:MAG: heme exporter protein CcmD [Robiginitomaculum sp.]|nr:MAG: heme exporter protein CcmD [Robiginitomaculum sp.]